MEYIIILFYVVCIFTFVWGKCFKKSSGDDTLLQLESIDRALIHDEPEFDLNTIYEKCIEEMTLQQAKRDQIITIYLAMFSFIVPFALSTEQLNLFAKGLVFLAIAIIGFAFSLIIVRYRMYKESYWLCCQALTNLMGLQRKALKKKVIQKVYYTCLWKKGKSYLIGTGSKKKFSKWLFFKKNVFSGETIYCLLHSFIVSILFGMSIFLMLFENPFCVIYAAISGALLFLLQNYFYFHHLLEVYNVLVDGKNDSFNKTFGKAWFLHMYIDEEAFHEKQN